MEQLTGPALAGLALVVCATAIGIPMIRKLVMVHEARHELRHGSAGFLRNLAGWSVIGFWLLATWFAATIIGDWGQTGDLDGAIARSWLRLQIVLEIVAALAQAD